MSTFQQYNTYDGLTACRVASAINVAGTYFNGNSNNGVGAKLTIAASSLTIDSVVLRVADRLLLTAQTSANQNGIYVVNSIGATVICQRAADFQDIEQIKAGQFVSIAAGTANGGAFYSVIEPLPARFGIDDLFLTSVIPAGFGTAATKDASDNTKATVSSVAAATTTGNILQANDTAGTVANGPVAANKVLTSSLTTPDVNANLVSFDVTVTAAALAAGGQVTLLPSSGTKRYKIRSLQLNGFGTNFSGGGGDRLGQIDDGTTLYSLVPAAGMQTLANAQWGTTNLPNPPSAAINTSTVAGAVVYFKYAGGATDYTAGSVVVSGVAERVV